jgi:hypothetical protein
MCKLMELIIEDQLLSYLLRKYFISGHHNQTFYHYQSIRMLTWLVSRTWKFISVDFKDIDFRRALDCIVFTKRLYKLQYGRRKR